MSTECVHELDGSISARREMLQRELELQQCK